MRFTHFFIVKKWFADIKGVKKSTDDVPWSKYAAMDQRIEVKHLWCRC